MTLNIDTISQWNHHPQHFEFILNNLKQADISLYNQGKSYTEVEHQVGRYLNMKQIASEIMDQQIPGDVVEFGTYQGLGLLMMMQCFAAENVTSRKFIGLDSFLGLPESSNGWVKGSFSDTSIEAVTQYLGQHLVEHPMLEAFLISGWFNDPKLSADLMATTNDVAMVHFDADLGSSTLQALNVITPLIARNKHPVYFLFDDWGIHPDEVPIAWTQWCNDTQDRLGLNIVQHSKTKLTKNFLITFIK